MQWIAMLTMLIDHVGLVFFRIRRFGESSAALLSQSTSMLSFRGTATLLRDPSISFGWPLLR